MLLSETESGSIRTTEIVPVAIFPDELIPLEPTVNELEIFTSAGKPTTIVSVA